MSGILATIVEGHGEVEALPILLRRCIELWHPEKSFQVPPPIRIPKSKLIKPTELERGVRLAAAKARGGPVLVLLDSDDDCPASLGPELLKRATEVHDRVRVVLAKSEFESWFLAACESISGARGLKEGLTCPTDCEGIRDAKGWLARAMTDPIHSSYSETLDQPKLAARFDLQAALDRSASFTKLKRDLASLV